MGPTRHWYLASMRTLSPPPPIPASLFLPQRCLTFGSRTRTLLFHTGWWMSISMSNGKSESKPSENGQFPIVKEELCYSRYLNVYNRVVQFPVKTDELTEISRTVDYDIVGSKTVSFHYCTVLPFSSVTKLVTLIKEYAQGANDFMYGVPCGGLSEKHLSIEDCVRKELSEEAHLNGGELVKLIPEQHPGILEVKWCRNRFSPYLILDPKVDPNPYPKDPEEIIEVMTVDVPTLKGIMYSGNMMLPSIVTCAMALSYLEDHKLL